MKTILHIVNQTIKSYNLYKYTKELTFQATLSYRRTPQNGSSWPARCLQQHGRPAWGHPAGSERWGTPSCWPCRNRTVKFCQIHKNSSACVLGRIELKTANINQKPVPNSKKKVNFLFAFIKISHKLIAVKEKGNAAYSSVCYWSESHVYRKISAFWTLCENGRSRCRTVSEILNYEDADCGTMAGDMG